MAEGDEKASCLVRTRVVHAARRAEVASATHPVRPGLPVLIGREGDIPLGIEPVDTGISRRAVKVVAGSDGWQIEALNGNGVVLHLWGQAQAWLDDERPSVHSWPRVGLRVVGSNADLQHWVLLESDSYPLTAPPQSASTQTVTPSPLPLTDAQVEAVTAVFEQHLAWPPVAGPIPNTLDVAARRLGISTAAVYQRLEAVRARAYAFGSHRQISVTDPEYVYVLVRRRFLAPPFSY